MSKKLRAVFLVILGVLALCCFGALAACGNSPASSEQPPQDVAVDTISYDGSVFKWGQVQGTGISYKITVNDGMEIPTTALSYAYPTTSNVTVYTISVKAINQYGESNPVSRTFYQMETIEAEDLTFDAEGTMTWQPVPNAVSYIVEVNGREIPVSSTEFSDFEYGQRNSIRVKPVGADSSYFSKWTSSSVSKTYLAQPDNIKYDGQFITWSGSPSASSYAVYINGNLYQEGIRQAQVEYDAQNASFDVSVQAEGDGSQVFSSQVSSESNFIYLGAVTGISVNEDAVLVWNEVEGADYYSLEYTYRGNTTTIKPDGNSYDGLPAGASIDVRIRPMINGDNENSSVYYSTWSERVTVAILQAPSPKWNSSFSLTDGQEARALYWDSVTLGDVSAYNVKVVFTPSSGSGQSTTNIYSATADNPSFSFAYTEVGTYKISLQAVAEVNSDWSNSRYSGEMTVIRLAAPNRPTNDEFIESNPRALNEGFKVSYEGVSGASGYRLLMDGAATAYTSTSQSISVKDVGANNSQQTQTIHYAIQSIGSVKSVGNLPVVTLDSLTASSLQFEIQVLAMPQNLTVSGGVLRWNTVTGANGYAVDMGVTQSVNGTEFSLENNIQAEGDYQVSVCACGNSAEVLASAYSQNINVVKLSAPYNVRISTGENEGTLLWDGPLAGVTSYNIFFNGSNDPVSNSNLDNINRYIVSNGVTVVVQAIANAWNADQTVYYLNSNRSQTFQFIKLLPVTFPSPAFTDTNFIWEAPANVGNANITYTVEMDGYTLNGVADGASYDISAVAAGPHTFRVRAIGDGSSTISSDWSAAVDIIKLETPEVTRTQTQYEWPSVIGATGYQVYVDNVLAQTIAEDYTTQVYSYTPQFEEYKTYTVEVIALGDNGVEYINSSPCTITQKMERIAAPEFTFQYSHERYDPSARILITVTTPRENTAGYLFTVNGVTSALVTGTTYEYAAGEHGEYVISVQAVGGTFDDEGVYWFDSLEAGGNDRTTLTVLGSPNVSTISITAQGRITWTAVTGVKSYTLKITYSDGTVNEVTATSATYLDANFKNIVSIEICCNGNGTTQVSSEFVIYTR